MKKAEFIGQALLRLTGGVLTSDNAVRWPEAETYLALAVNYVQTGNYWAESKAEGESTVNPLLVQAFDNVAVEFSDYRNQKYADLPLRILSLPKGRGLELYTQCGVKLIPLTKGDDAMGKYYDCFKTVVNYQPEGNRVWFGKNFPPLVEAIRGKGLIHVSSLGDDDEVLLPSDGDVKVLDLMYAWLSGEKEAPKDYKVDAKDN